ncbi:MAG TPA: protein kinase [Gemmatimonadaceae bacterium]|nr:protein kinase [Gemmatimonadaceae bacterium]
MSTSGGDEVGTGVGVRAGVAAYAPMARALPSHIGPYRVIDVLGEGGMGVVYLAEQDEPVRREVALKVLRPGANSKLVVARFESERQALAVMEHPNITRVYDAGETETGLPYFVMERVDGVPITEYAAAHRLTTRERVRLFTQVCRAVQHAHQKGIIHRDIKPSNVLVTEADGAPLCKVIDFGIAKAVAPAPGDPHLTQTGTPVGTPAYMSPEQVMGSGIDVDTRADIYSLGVLLYELLAGVLPFDPVTHPGWALLAQQLSQDAPAPSAHFGALGAAARSELASERRTEPTALRSALSGDLDCVVLKALEKDRERRYPSAGALAADLEHYLADEPVTARPPDRVYRARKFVRRHRAAVSFAAAAVVMLVAFAAVMAVQARRIAHARAVAEARQGQAEELIGFMLGDLRTRLTPIGRLDVLDDVGKKALGYFAAVPESELSSTELFRRSQALQQLGQVRQDQGNLAAAADAYRQSLALAQGLAARDPRNDKWQLGLGAAYFYVGQLQWQQGDFDGALAHLVPYLRITEALVARAPDSLAYRLELAQANSNIGSVKEAKGDAAGALDAFRASLAIEQALVRRDSSNAEWRLNLAQTYNAIGVVQRKLGDLADAERSHRAEIAIKGALVGRDTSDRQLQRSLAVGQAYLGNLLLAMGDVDGAASQFRPARAIYASLAANDTGNADWQRNLANGERLLGEALLLHGDLAGAQRELSASRARLERVFAASPQNRVVRRDLARARVALGRTWSQAGRGAAALALADEALAAVRPALESNPGDAELRRVVAEAELAGGEFRDAAGDRAGARESWASALTTIDSAARASRETDLTALRAIALLHLDRVDEAKPIVRDLLARGYRERRFVALVNAKGATRP